MFKKFLIILLLMFSLSIVSALSIQSDYSKYTFPVITEELEITFKEIREFTKSYNLLPFTKEKGIRLTNDVADIIIKGNLNKKYILKKKPLVNLLASQSLINPMKRLYYLQIVLILYENDQLVNGKPIIGDLIIIKHVFIVDESLKPKFKI